MSRVTTAGFERLRDAEPQALTTHATSDAASVVAHVRSSFESGKTLSIKWRMEQLRRVERMMQEQCDNIIAALKEDLGRPDIEGLFGDVTACSEEARYALDNLATWMKPEKLHQPLHLQPGSSVVLRQPKGVVLIIGAWNFAFQLTIVPLIAAIAAGCCAIVKPSEVSPACALLLEKMLTTYLDPACIRVVQGAVPETTALLAQPFDHIFYTGNAAVAKIVMAAAAKNLTPVTLELGGKSPAIVDTSANLPVSMKRLLAGKYFNAGQICISPDYLLCVGNEQREAEVIAQIKRTIQEMFGEDPKSSSSFGRMVNERHWDRVVGLLKSCDGAEVVCGGLDTADRAVRYIPPTVLRGVDPSSAVMQEEIFGPVLPIVRVPTIEDAIRFINLRARPLALYMFASNKRTIDRVVNSTTAGGTCINDTLMHCTSPVLPFGGIGPSGLGSYHGRHGFNELSHHRSVMNRPTWLDPDFRYAPYQAKYFNLFKWYFLSKRMSPGTKLALTLLLVLVLLAVIAVIVYFVAFK